MEQFFPCQYKFKQAIPLQLIGSAGSPSLGRGDSTLQPSGAFRSAEYIQLERAKDGSWV